ncbi:hypothetical protein AMTR_s00008p00259640 [Amborella trichopoda]|uniref:Uncharacterized protein n=1 Tax=Amborella trichopoda TaxID=13333 RepID=W1NJ09_AMBTC|nr:hypothetical protein AMTR_s00008p00259640 [Amborella trichopoda]
MEYVSDIDRRPVPFHCEVATLPLPLRMLPGFLGFGVRVSIYVGRRPSHRGKAPVEEDGAGASESVQGVSSHPSSRGAAQSSRDAEGVGCDIPDLVDGGAFFDEDTVPPSGFLTYEEW